MNRPPRPSGTPRTATVLVPTFRRPAELSLDDLPPTFARDEGLAQALVIGRSFIDRDHGRPIFEVGGMVKDLDLALELGHGAGAAMPTVAQVRELFGLAAPEHGGDEITSVIEVFGRIPARSDPSGSEEAGERG